MLLLLLLLLLPLNFRIRRYGRNSGIDRP